LLGDVHDAEDAVQDTLQYLLEHPQEETKRPGYLVVSVRNHCFRVLRRRYEESQEVPRLRDFLLHFDPGDLPEDDRFEKQRRRLRASIARLSQAEQNVVRPFLRGLSLHQIAHHQGARLKTVQRTWLRALDRLKRIAQEDPDGRKRVARRPASLVARKPRTP
jgi:RNA polymerase sigma factor (sigma-70 family)